MRIPGRRRVFLLVAVLAVGLILRGTISRAAEESASVENCEKGSLFELADTSPSGLQYAPDRKADIIHVIIDVTPNFKDRIIGGKTTIRFKPIAKPLSELRLNAVNLRISSVDSSAKVATYNSTPDDLTITFEKPIEPGAETTVTIAHEAEPRQGLYFRTREMGYKPGDDHLFTQGEQYEARHWFPCFDTPSEKFTSEVICHVPDGMTALSNGVKVGETKDSNGLTAIHWSQQQPHSGYLIALCAGYFKGIEDKHGNLPIGFYTPPSYAGEAANSFNGTKDMLEYFDKEIGLPYPWAKYYQVVVDDFVAGGMENTSMTILTTRTLFTEASENIRSSEGLVSHELAHQWFGDYVTCKDWSHTWLNEGFATYYALLYAGNKHGRDDMLYQLYGNLEQITGAGNAKDLLPIVNKKYEDASVQFAYRSYEKGGWVLHMLRSQLGDDLYRKAIKSYLDKHAHQNVVTDDLIQSFEETSGRSLDQFFDQWVFHGHYPELEVSYRWMADRKLAKVSVRQTQEVSDKVLLFSFPLKLRFKGKGGTTDYDALVNEKQHDFYIPLKEAPQIVRVDPELALLAKINFDPGNELLLAQLADKEDAIGRVIACRGLGGKDDKKTIDRLKTALNSDGFHGVRIAAATALGRIHSDDSLAALLPSIEQKDARVRQRVVTEVARFYSEDALTATRRVIDTEKNPEVVAPAVRSLGKYPDDAPSRESIAKALASKTYNQTLAVAAFDAIRAQDSPDWRKPLQETLTTRSDRDFGDRSFSQGLNALGYISRDAEDKTETREFLKGYLSSKRQGVRTGAISALGELRDPSAIAVVEATAETAGGRGARRTIDTAVAAMRESKKLPVEVGDLRTEVLDLKKKLTAMEKEVEDMKKQLQAAAKQEQPASGAKQEQASARGKKEAPAAEKSGRKKILGLF